MAAVLQREQGSSNVHQGATQLFAFEVGEMLQSAFIKKAEKVAVTQVIVITGALPQMADKLIEVPLV